MSYITYEKIDRVGVITLDRADKANAVNGPMLDELDEAWSMAAADRDVRVIVV
ncbi:MAG: enoyl-CoA hydratase, partial [Bacteroidia bacterium]